MAKRLCRIMTGIADAQAWANKLLQPLQQLGEARGPGDMENAMRRLEARYGVPWRTFWQLRYRPPADVFVGVYLSLKAAYEAECERQERLLRHEREITKAKVQDFEALGSATAEPPRRESDLT